MYCFDLTFNVSYAAKVKALLRNVFPTQVDLGVRRLAGQLLPMHYKRTMTHLQETY
jgi:hypothetical protein